ncbi:MAG: hypothetical protein WBE31_19700 [Candidatus Sulfotelmatobacter sp.]
MIVVSGSTSSPLTRIVGEPGNRNAMASASLRTGTSQISVRNDSDTKMFVTASTAG